MKKCFLLILCAVITMSAWGRQRAINEAENIARSTFQKNAAKSKSLKSAPNLKIVRSSTILERMDITANHEAFYVCKPEDDSQGYVLVSADDRMPAVLAMSDDGVFDENNIPENMLCLLGDYANALDAIEKGYATVESIFYPKSTEEVTIEPLLGDIKYNQGSPYNTQCPLRPSTNTRPATGCVATAMAQVMRYHRWPQNYATGSISYTSKTEKDTIAVSYDFSKVKFDWAGMMDGYKGTKGTDYTGTDTITTADSMNFFAYANFYYSDKTNIKVDSMIVINEDKAFSGTLQLLLADENGKFLQPVGTAKAISSRSYGVMTKLYTFTITMPGTYENGNYRIYVGSKLVNSNEWSYIKHAPDWDKLSDKSTHVEDYISVVKKGDYFYIGDTQLACYYTQRSMDAVAQLMAACGASIKMQYGSSSSASTSAIPSAAYNYFGYDHNALYISTGYMTTDGWHEKLQGEMKEARPVLYRGESDSGGGHAFVLDGLKFEDGLPYYHVNWGWGGSSNGYCLVTMLKPTTAGTGGSVTNYAHSNGMILNFKPDDGVESYSLGCRGMSVDTTYVIPGNKITATVTSMINLGVAKFAGSMIMCLVDSTGKRYTMGNCYTTSGLSYNYYLTNSKTIEYTVPASMPMGDYTLTMYCISNDGNKTDTYNAHEITIHVVPEDPATAMEGILRYDFDGNAHTAKVRRFCTSVDYTATRYKGDIVVPEMVTYQGVDYNVTAIGDSAFYGCTGLTSLVMPDQIETIGDYVFTGCTSLTSVTYPKDYKGPVGAQMFKGCTALESLTLPDSVTSIETLAFSENGVKSLVVPPGVTTIATKAFQDNTSIKEVVLPEGLTTVSLYAFRYCTALEKFNIPSTWVKILNFTFQGCTALKTLTIPETVTSIGGSAFKGCSGLTAIYVMGETPATLASKAFDETNDCPIYVPAEKVDTYKTAWKNYASRIQANITGIKGVTVSDNEKESSIYTLDGMKVTNLVKGNIYIINGKKVLVK